MSELADPLSTFPGIHPLTASANIVLGAIEDRADAYSEEARDLARKRYASALIFNRKINTTALADPGQSFDSLVDQTSSQLSLNINRRPKVPEAVKASVRNLIDELAIFTRLEADPFFAGLEF